MTKRAFYVYYFYAHNTPSTKYFTKCSHILSWQDANGVESVGSLALMGVRVWYLLYCKQKKTFDHSQGYIFRILQHFATKLGVLFNAVIMNCTISNFLKFCLLGNRSIVLKSSNHIFCLVSNCG